MSKVNRKDLKHPDRLQQEIIKFMTIVSKHLKTLMLAVYIIIGIVLVTFSYQYFHARQLRKDTSLYYYAIKEGDNKSREEKFKEIIPKLKTVEIKCYVSYKLADYLYNDKKYKDALPYYQNATSNAKGLLQELARYGLAKTYQATNKLDKAVKIYREIIKDKFHVYRAMSMLSLSEVYKSQKKTQLALATLENLIISYKNTEYSKLAHIYKKELN